MAAKLKVRPAEGEPYEMEIGNTATIGRSRENTISCTQIRMFPGSTRSSGAIMPINFRSRTWAVATGHLLMVDG